PLFSSFGLGLEDRRRLANPAFGPRSLNELRQFIRSLAQKLSDNAQLQLFVVCLFACFVRLIAVSIIVTFLPLPLPGPKSRGLGSARRCSAKIVKISSCISSPNGQNGVTWPSREWRAGDKVTRTIAVVTCTSVK